MMAKENVSEHSFKDGCNDGGTFEVYEVNGEWFWSVQCGGT